jgi:hypothetical protein
VRKAVAAARNSKAVGPDGLTIFHLKNLGNLGLSYLTGIFNLSLSLCKIPAIFKKSIVNPLLKPGKPVTEASSYRPVSLLCPAAKVMEKCILSCATSTGTSTYLATHQHGFRPLHCTTSAL